MEKDVKAPLIIFAADIGGTNANFGLMSYAQGIYTLIQYYQVKSQTIENFTTVVKNLVDSIIHEKELQISGMVIGIAAPVYDSMHRVKPTHLPFFIDKSALISATGIADIFFINDFMSVVYGYDLVKDTLALTSVAGNPHAQKAFIGAGTGLGQAFSVWSKAEKHPLALVSEGGHTTFSVATMFDYDVQFFIKHRLAQTTPVTWEQVLSGSGISLLYEFFGLHDKYPKTAIAQEIEDHHFQPDFISRYAEHDQRCKDVFSSYRDYYARFAQQVALQSVCYGGLYIAGGIASKNKKLFLDADFMRVFTQHAQHSPLLAKIPIFLIQDYKVSLYGAAHYYRRYLGETV